MEFPIYRKDLQEMNRLSEKILNEQANEKIQNIMVAIVENVKYSAECGKKWYSYDLTTKNNSLIVSLKEERVNHLTGEKFENTIQRSILPNILQMLKIKFPDCSINLSSSKEFITINWS